MVAVSAMRGGCAGGSGSGSPDRRSAAADLARCPGALDEAARRGAIPGLLRLMFRLSRGRGVAGLRGRSGRVRGGLRARGGGLRFVFLQAAVLVLPSRAAMA